MVATRTLVLLVAVLSGTASGQVGTQVAFAPGGKDLLVVDLAGTRVGTLPRGIERLSGTVDVVIKDGRPMLRATNVSELLIKLPGGQQLPPTFTIEVDLIPKVCCPPPDLTLEGTATLTQDKSSAHLLWTADADHGFVAVIGGAEENKEFPIPDTIRATLPGVLTKVGVSVEGNTIRMYNNERELYTVQATFYRGNVLRITLGGLTDAEGMVKPVYLARVRIATGAPVTVAQQKSGLNEATPPVTGIVARVGAQGDASVAWSALTGATSYFVVRWKVDNTDCCTNFSPPTGISQLNWTDGVLPVPGTYAYRVYATTSSGISVGETTVAYPSVVAGPPPSGADRMGTTRTSAPAARTIDLSLITALGGSGAVAPRTIDLATVTATGPVAAISPRTINLAVIEAVGPVRSTTRSLGSSVPVLAPRTIALAELLGTGGLTVIKPRMIALPMITASGVPRPAARTIQLAGWTSKGTSRTP